MTPPHNGSALVLFSGGQDSTVCLAWALSHYAHVETIGFDYGQRHAVELDVRKTVLAQLPAVMSDVLSGDIGELGDDHLLTLSTLAEISDTALTREAEIEMTDAGLPSTFVPGRNLLFLTYAAAVGYRRKISTLVGGMCETDYSGYPDCRNETLKTLEVALSKGMDTPVKIETPLMYIDKAATWAMAHELGGDALVDLIITDTHTCYIGDRSKKHPWGYGCGDCPACQLRAKGWASWTAENDRS